MKSWMLAVLAVLVCALTAVVFNKALGGGSEGDSSTVVHVVSVMHPAQPERRQEPKKTAKAKQDREKPPLPVSLTPQGGKASPSAHEGTKAPPMPPAAKTSRPGLRLAGETISVDPGHNGGNASDPEAINRLVPADVNGTTKPCNTTGTETNDGSLTEAQFNWDVAKDLVPRLEHLGARVVLTRHDNEGVGPCVNERAGIANRAHADVALSIHADGNYAVGAHGFDVIHPSPEESVAPQEVGPSLQLAEAERNALVGAGIPPANYVGENGLDERSDLAGLNLAKVPAVLVELGNMREPSEAVKLEDPAYRQKLAGALAEGVVAFLAR